MNGVEIQSLLPPLMGIITANRLGLQGWVKIPAFLMTSLVTREMIEQLEIELSTLSGETPLSPTENLTASPSVVVYTIVHTIPGRIRFHIPRLLKDKKYAQRLMRLARADSRIKQARINQDTASWVVNYQTGRNGSSQGNHQEIEVAELVKLIESAAMLSDSAIGLQPNHTLSGVVGAACAQRIEYEPQENGLQPNYEPMWTGCKASTLAVMLDLMANLPI